MYVCVCRSITDRQIKAVVNSGACTIEQVQRCLPVAQCCGTCEEAVCDLISETPAAGDARLLQPC